MRTFLFSLIAFFTFIPVILFAQEDNNNLVNLPIGETNSFNDYINAVYLMFISIAALIAVVKIIIAGVKYMFSDIVTQKSDAKNDIKGALLGLLVVLSAVVILTIINPDLTTFDPDITRTERREPLSEDIVNTILAEDTTSENCSRTCNSRRCRSPNSYSYDCSSQISTCNQTGTAIPLPTGRSIICSYDSVNIPCGERVGRGGTLLPNCSAARSECTSRGDDVIRQSGDVILCRPGNGEVVSDQQPTEDEDSGNGTTGSAGRAANR